MIEIPKWAEMHDQRKVTDEALRTATEEFLDDRQRGELQWSFLAGCFTGPAKTKFASVEQLNGLDAWRQAVRQIDHGMDIRLEELRREIRVIHLKPIKDLESTRNGVTEFEAKMSEFVEAGGEGFSNEQGQKSDLLAILPSKLREDIVIIRMATDRAASFEQFRDFM